MNSKLCAKFRYLIAFGSNLGNKALNLERGQQLLKEGSCEFLTFSRVLKTEPLKHPDFDTSSDEDYLNQVAEIESDFPPFDLYQLIVQVEDALGHERTSKWKPRHLDIDILFCAVGNRDKTFEECAPYLFLRGTLKVPHEGFKDREFLHKLVFDDLKITKNILHKYQNLI
jgi:2-amino-4-hydroxy-6-hydroxymethyldihydropteridine diphosphokinase